MHGRGNPPAPNYRSASRRCCRTSEHQIGLPLRTPRARGNSGGDDHELGFNDWFGIYTTASHGVGCIQNLRPVPSRAPSLGHPGFPETGCSHCDSNYSPSRGPRWAMPT